jgi:hypothetical protein
VAPQGAVPAASASRDKANPPVNGSVPRTPAPPPSYAYLHVVNAFLLLALWLLAATLYDHLPDRIPGHIGPTGVTRWEPRSGGHWFLLPILGTVHAGLLYALSTLAHAGQGVNVPGRKRIQRLPLPVRRYVVEPLRPFMFGLATWLLLLVIHVQLSLYRIALAAQDGNPDTTPFLAGIFALLVLPLAGAVWLMRAVRRRLDEVS